MSETFYTQEQVDALVEFERLAAWELVTGLIVEGDLPGNGTDKNAQRNGIILAANELCKRVKVFPLRKRKDAAAVEGR